MSTFSAKLIHWQKLHGRSNLPWQNTRDPYAIWVSEIMLQQTQVTTVIPYYLRFLQRFPDIESVASSSVDEVLALWSGLGYYSRGRNLHQAARLIARDQGGIFPRNFEVIQQLPGIGRSTAAAIAVFAYGEQRAILDGNVKRVFARCFGVDGYPGERKNELLLWRKAEELLPESYEGNQIEIYTQALMDLGATVCTRGQPKCMTCPLQQDCIALRNDCVARLPVSRLRRPLPEKETVLLMLMKQGKVLLGKRPATGIWGGLWCLPEMPVGEDAIAYCMQHFGMKVKPLAHMPPLDHTFTHFKLRIHPRPLQVVSYPAVMQAQEQDETMWIMLDDALEAAIPAPVRKLILQHGYPQSGQLPFEKQR
ncbi:MAG TPA: A/G-specific adenine glycosylase [Nitrosospira sp.]|jgi:A/G-specific adenine glycosylase|uniref:A/G-specific adenine glycosylase n=1 Tax=Nitrosospira sp. Nsp13 TaxID=1855332 RepID=UPI00087F3C4B|nr:A/G-specific adenine glycosylase [Nitrosospira sp. Nsp13]SCY30436.1 A/G-specific DNA-adenine glycosylase [Nitrosospira sp. Nsp13]